MQISQLVEYDKTISLFGLAKNTGKTETLNALLREFHNKKRVIGITSIGRDGEEYDAINDKISKPRIYVNAANLVATTEGLLRKSKLSFQLIKKTLYRTSLGQVAIARMLEDGDVEIAGPNNAEDIRSVSDAMLDLGAENVLIDGAINRKAASSPKIADSVVVATGAILDHEIKTVVAETKNAVDMVRLPEVKDPDIKIKAAASATSLLFGADNEFIPIEQQILVADVADDIAKIVAKGFPARLMLVKGSLSEPFIENLLKITRKQELILTVVDSTRLFLNKHDVNWYRRQGLHIQVLQATKLKAITINPIAPESHRFDSVQFRELIQEAIPDVHTFDVLDAHYVEAQR